MLEKGIRKRNEDYCYGGRAVLLGLYLLRYTLFSLLDTFLLGGVAHPQFTESVHQLIIGGVEFQRMEPGLAGL
jgi:hypothetical protein